MEIDGKKLKEIVSNVIKEIDYRQMSKSFRDEEEADRQRMIMRHGWDPLDQVGRSRANRWEPRTEQPPPWKENPSLMDDIKEGDVITRSRGTSFGVRNMQVLSVTGESPNRVWEVVSVNVDKDGNIVHYNGPNYAELEKPEPGIIEKVTEEQMGSRNSLWQLEKFEPGLRYNTYRPRPSRFGSRYRPYGRST